MGVVTAAAVMEAASVVIAQGMVSLAMASAAAVVLVVITMEDVAITLTEDMPIPISVFVDILITIPTTVTGIGLRSVILMAGATESGYRIIEGEGYFLKEPIEFAPK